MPHLYHIVSSSFEAAARIPILASSHPASRLHGHSYQVSFRLFDSNYSAASLAPKLEYLASLLNYRYLNEMIAVPTDENISRWFLDKVDFADVHQVAIQSTPNSGVDLDQYAQAHIWRRYRFEAAHQLPNVEAGHPCGRMHGHGFEVILHLNQNLVDADMGIDFDTLDSLWEPLNQQLDQACLNNIPGLENPTSENLCYWIWQKIKPLCEALSWVTVYETHSSGCHYNGELYRIWKEFLFESAVTKLQNKQKILMGHSYKIRLHLSTKLDDFMGWTVDYGDVKKSFQTTYALLDHQHLDKSTGIVSENNGLLLHWIRQQLCEKTPALDRIDLYQQPGLGSQLCWGKEGPAIPD